MGKNRRNWGKNGGNYLNWLSEIAIPDAEQRDMYQKLLLGLYSEDFYWLVKNDGNRAGDGEHLRWIFEQETGSKCEKTGPCSVLEALVALAQDCENEIMYDPDEGDRTGVWFWEMIENLGLDGLDDWCFDEDDFEYVVRRFLDRKYKADGQGGPFVIRGFRGDLRRVELWYQLNFYMKNRCE